MQQKLKLFVTLLMLCLSTTAWADGNWTSGGCDVTLSGGTLTVSKSSTGDGAMANYTTDLPWKGSVGSITSIVIEDGVTHIGNCAFLCCDNASLTSVTIPASVTSIGDEAFYSCLYLATVTFADGSQLVSIGDGAFKSTALMSFTIPANVTSIGNSAFYECEQLTSVTIPNGVTSIGDNAFERSGLTSVTIPVSMTSIGNSAFNYCESLTTVIVYAPSCSLGVEAFDWCPHLPSINVFEDYMTWYKSATNWSAYSIKIEAIQNSGSCGAPGHKSDVKYVLTGTSPNYTLNIMKMGETGAMEDYTEDILWLLWDQKSDNITSVVIGNGVTYIGDYAFKGCTNLASVTIADNPAIGTDAFPSGATVTMNLTANAAGGANWMTFYSTYGNFKADNDTQVFKAELDDSNGTLTLHKIDDRIVDKQEAVILKSSGNPVMTLTTSSSSDSQDNSLTGVSNSDGMGNDGHLYVLNNGTNGVGFYKLKTTTAKLGYGKAFLWYDSSASNFLGFEEETTRLNDVRCKMSEVRGDVFFDLSGRKVENPKKGIYIHNGRKEVLK